MTDRPDYFDVAGEPNFFEGSFAADPTENEVLPLDGRQDEIGTVRDLVGNEPALTGQAEQAQLGEWIGRKRSECTASGSLLVTVTAALIAGPFSIIGVFMSGSQTSWRLVYLILFGPIIEELLKQSGMIYLLEKRPYRLFTAWQFILAAIISAMVFAAVENLLYIHLYTRPSMFNGPQAFVCYRWTVCLLVHVTCSIVASIGLMNVWQKQMADGRAADLSQAFGYFATAMGIHGLYNLSVTLINHHF
jgi:RsiW-degrading membrane proteinase PrsW (M82 family)